MLVNFKEMLEDAEKHNYAVASINTSNLMALRAIIAAAEDLNCPVILNHAQGEEPLISLEAIAPLMIMYAEQAKVPVSVHVDHGLDFSFCMRAIRAGFTSIMYDCSSEPLEKNIAEVNKLIEIARPLGISVEAELGNMPNNMPLCVPGQEKSDLSDLSVYFTKVEEAEKFVQCTDVDALTISFGTIHGVYDRKSNLDIQRVKEIKEAIKGSHTLLVMHGASGTEPEQIVQAISAGIRKINYFTDMDTCTTPKLMEYINSKKDGKVNFSKLADIAREAMYERCKQTLELFLSVRN